MIALLLLAGVSASTAESQQPPQQPKSDTQAPAPANNSGQSIVVTVNQPPGQEQRAQPSQATSDQNSGTSPDIRMVRVTETIAFFTFALVVVGGWQAWTYFETLRANKVIERAYLSPAFQTAAYQDELHNFETRVTLSNTGHTPAYDVKFRAAIQVVPFPVPSDFEFRLPIETAGMSSSFIAPGADKFISRVLPLRVPDADVAGIKHGGPPSCLLSWGLVNYRDAFKKPRYLKYAFVVRWIESTATDKTGAPLPPQQVSSDTAEHNNAD